MLIREGLSHILQYIEEFVCNFFVFLSNLVALDDYYNFKTILFVSRFKTLTKYFHKEVGSKRFDTHLHCLIKISEGHFSN